MELLRDLVKEQGIVDIITDYKEDLEQVETDVNKQFDNFMKKCRRKNDNYQNTIIDFLIDLTYEYINFSFHIECCQGWDLDLDLKVIYCRCWDCECENHCDCDDCDCDDKNKEMVNDFIKYHNSIITKYPTLSLYKIKDDDNGEYDYSEESCYYNIYCHYTKL